MFPLLSGVNWEYVVVDLIGAVPIQILYGYVMTRLLDFPRPAVFVAAYSLCSLAILSFSSMFDTWLVLLAWLLLGAAPAFFVRDRASHRVLIVASSIVIAIVAYLAFLLIWMAVVDDPTSYQAKYEQLPKYAVASALHLIVLDVIFVWFRHVQGRLLTPQVKRYVGEGPKYFIWFPLLQIPFLVIALVGIDSVDAWNPLLAVFVFSLGVVLLVADLALFHAIDRFVLERYEASRIELLERQLADELRFFDDLSLVLENSAQLRHDLRNHMQVIEVLASRGDFDSARGHVRSLLGEIERTNESDSAIALRVERHRGEAFAPAGHACAPDAECEG